MKVEGLLPIGSVVMLFGGNHRLMITGYAQKMVDRDDTLYDYVACPYPEGYIGPEQNYLFNREQVEKVYNVGYQTDGQFAYVEKVEQGIRNFRQKLEQDAK